MMPVSFSSSPTFFKLSRQSKSGDLLAFHGKDPSQKVENAVFGHEYIDEKDGNCEKVVDQTEHREAF
jgi:hypothetical protein